MNQAEPCWFVFAVVNRKPPLPVTVGWLGEPFVITWQLDAGVPLFAQTFVGLKPPTGKLNDCAAIGCDPKMTPTSSPTATQPPRSAVFILRFLRFLNVRKSARPNPERVLSAQGSTLRTRLRVLPESNPACTGETAGEPPAILSFRSPQCQGQSRRWCGTQSDPLPDERLHIGDAGPRTFDSCPCTPQT